MKPVYQTKFGDEGNCLEACLASLLEIPIEDVPTLEPQPGDTVHWIDKMNNFLRQYGITTMFFQPNLPVPKNTYYLISGISPRGLDHATIGKNGVIVHDPHPDGGGVDPVTDICIFVQLFERRGQ